MHLGKQIKVKYYFSIMLLTTSQFFQAFDLVIMTNSKFNFQQKNLYLFQKNICNILTFVDLDKIHVQGQAS